jgi:outer membrane translocation and assembly module TamA
MKCFVSAVSLTLLVSFCTVAQTQPQVTIGHIAIVDTPGISQDELNQIADEVEGKTCTADKSAQCIGERVRNAFQERGYFKASVLEPRVKPSTRAGKVEANVVVDPGALYRVAKFELGGKPIFSPSELAPSITVHTGTIFNIREVRETMENLRHYYVSRGYSKISMIADTQVDEQTHELSITLDIQPEG